MLDVYLYDSLVGHIREEGPHRLNFAYGEQALDEPEKYVLSVRLPVRAEPYGHDATMVFFENLLPEGEGRDRIAQAKQFSPADVSGLLGMIGGECAGAVSLWPAGVAPSSKPAYRPLSPAELAALFDQEYGEHVMEMQVAERLSMSGAQQKMVFRRRGDAFELPLHGSPSNAIIKRAKPVYPGLVLNELACMWLLRACGFEAAESRAVGGERLLFESVRYDRVEDAEGGLRRLHQEDFCQATGHRSAQKYQARGGPAYEVIGRVIRRHSVDPLRDLDTLARWALFNVLVGNNDAHAKNLSLLYAGSRVRLAPIYDVVSTHVYPHIDRQFSIEIGGQKTAEGLHRMALDKFARSLGMRAPAIARLGAPLIEQVRSSLDGVLNRVAAEYTHHPVLDQVHDLVLQRASLLDGWLALATTKPK
ncbi:MAG TPA: type II toxin-antitoxin system HipA family toxin, partial [Longimicrobium sp.]|nr:type II toxin-antitoxin system HipA family toxin [Longimicrobium sp.]